MTDRVIADWNQFTQFLAQQPLCRWSQQKQQEIAQGLHRDRGAANIHSATAAAPKNDNADLAAALASMA